MGYVEQGTAYQGWRGCSHVSDKTPAGFRPRFRLTATTMHVVFSVTWIYRNYGACHATTQGSVALGPMAQKVLEALPQSLAVWYQAGSRTVLAMALSLGW